jgi:hypothetical protein
MYINIQVAKIENIFTYHIDITLQESVNALRLSAPTIATTWHGDPAFGHAGPFRLHEIVSEVENRTDQFINAWLSANLKQ